MKKLLPVLALLIGTGLLHGMKPENQYAIDATRLALYESKVRKQRYEALKHCNDKSLLTLKNEEGDTALHIACEQGDVDSIVKICQLAHQDVEKLIFSANNEGFLPIHQAAAFGHASAVDTLIQIHKKTGKNIWPLIAHCSNDCKITALGLAAGMGDVDVAKTLIKSAGRRALNLLYMQDKEYCTALHWAACYGHANVVKVILEAAGDSACELFYIQSFSHDDGTAIDLALRNNHANVIKIFIQMAGDDVIHHIKKQPNQTELTTLKGAYLQNQTIECSLCWDTKDGTECHIMDCWHMNKNKLSHGCIFCKECLTEHITLHLKENKSAHELTCPNQECRQKINASDIYALTKDLYNDFLDISFTEFKINNQNYIKSCPTPDCECSYEIDINNKIDKFECPNCKHTYCPLCQYDHKRMTCENAARYRAQKEKNEDTDQFKRCPKCKVFVEKINGCNHMTCKCKHEFCWICKAEQGTTKCDANGCAEYNVRTGILGGLFNF